MRSQGARRARIGLADCTFDRVFGHRRFGSLRSLRMTMRWLAQCQRWFTIETVWAGFLRKTSRRHGGGSTRAVARQGRLGSGNVVLRQKTTLVDHRILGFLRRCSRDGCMIRLFAAIQPKRVLGGGFRCRLNDQLSSNSAMKSSRTRAGAGGARFCGVATSRWYVLHARGCGMRLALRPPPHLAPVVSPSRDVVRRRERRFQVVESTAPFAPAREWGSKNPA